MSKTLSEILRTPEPQFSRDILELEKASGRPGIDVRLQSEIIGARILAMKELGLDPHDTAVAELSAALRNKMGEAVTECRRLLSLQEQASNDQVIDSIIQYLLGLHFPKKVWVLRRSVAKNLLRSKPPKKTMAVLGYRSLDSLLKREDIGVVYLVMRVVESAAWQKAFIETYRNLHSSDFEERGVTYVKLPSSLPMPHMIVRTKEVGYIGIHTPQKTMPHAFALASMLFLVHTTAELRSFSSYAKLQQVHKNFGKHYTRLSQDEALQVAQILGRHIHWRVIFHYYARQKKELPEFFGPHVQLEDIEWRQSEEIVSEHIVALKWWLPYSYIAHCRDGAIASFNAIDVLNDMVLSEPIDRPTSKYAREALWHELIVRYLTHDHLRSIVVNQLDQPRLEAREYIRRDQGSLL